VFREAFVKSMVQRTIKFSTRVFLFLILYLFAQHFRISSPPLVDTEISDYLFSAIFNCNTLLFECMQLVPGFM
jgi:hypothetical protein